MFLGQKVQALAIKNCDAFGTFIIDSHESSTCKCTVYLCNKYKTGKGRTNGADKVSTFTVTTSQCPGNSAFCMVQEHSLHSMPTIFKKHNCEVLITWLVFGNPFQIIWNWVCCSWHGFTNSCFRNLTCFEPIKEEVCSFSFFLVTCISFNESTLES